MNICNKNSLLQGLIAFFLFVPTSALSEIWWEARNNEVFGRVLTIVVRGEIASSDADVVSNAVLAEPNARVRLVVLSSGGGDLRAAMEIGRALREHKFDAVVPRGHVCASACVYLLAAAIDKTVRGMVGIHRPYFLSGDPNRIRQEIKNLRRRSVEYFRDMNIPEQLADDIFSVAPSDMRVLTEHELATYRLNSKDFATKEADTARMMKELDMSRQEYEAFQSDLTYYCEVYRRQPEQMINCIKEVSRRHGVPIGHLAPE